MTNKTIHAIKVPKLRFREFQDEWRCISIWKIGSVIRWASPRPQWDKRYYGGNVPRLMVADVTRDWKYVIPKVDFLTEEWAKLSRPCKVGTLTIVCSWTVWIPAILWIDACIHDGFLALINIDSNQYLTEYLYYQIYVLKAEFDSSATHGWVFTNLTTSILKDFLITVPEFPEQQKIASFFSLVDEKIEKLKTKKSLLEKYKKWAIKKIFSREIWFCNENKEEYGEWKEKKFSEVYEFLRTNSYSRDQLNYENWNVKNIHYGDIHTKYKSNFKIQYEHVPFINPDIENWKEFEYCLNWDLLIADASEDYKDIWKAIEIIDTNNIKIVSWLHTILARPKNDIAIWFSWYIMQDPCVRKQIMKSAQWVSVLWIGKWNLSVIKLHLPSFIEQEKIASFLSEIDKKIDTINTEIEDTEKWKKGLLQGMFI